MEAHILHAAIPLIA